MKQLFSKFLIILCLTTIVVPVTMLENFHPEKVMASTEDIYNGLPGDSGDPTMDNGEADEDARVGGIEIDGWTVPVDDPVIPPAISEINTFFDSNYTSSGDSGFLWAAENITQNPKLVLNPNDRQDLRILSCLGDSIPDFENNLDSLSVASGKPYADLAAMKKDKPEDFAAAVKAAQEKAKLNIADTLRGDLVNFACISGLDQTQAEEMMATDQESVDAIIANVKENIVIDRRILELLVNLVTPKDQGGAGHEKITVARIRKSYDRASRMISRESEATYEELAKQKENQIQSALSAMTPEQLAGASPNSIAGDPNYSDAIAVATINDGDRSTGDLLFANAEDDSNLSAHFKGEAVDISEVDNIKCTKVGKRRLLSDKKDAMPPTPIKLAWQTSEGYDKSPAPNYSSLNLNLRQLASESMAGFFDEFSIDPESEADLSDATLGDIAEIMGQSLIGEIINSPNNSLTGYNFSDTIRTIGGIILADKLALPRYAFVNSDITNIDQLKVKIGQSVVEKKANLPFGALSGNSLEEILKNVGTRTFETEIGVREGALAAGYNSQPELRILVGRAEIEKVLKLKSGTFKQDTSYGKLKEIAGERKVDLLFISPSSLDEQFNLALTTSISSRYKGNSLSPDDWASIIGAKKIADNVAGYNFSTASGNALGLNYTSPIPAPAATPTTPAPNTTPVGLTAESATRLANLLNGSNLPANFVLYGIAKLSSLLSVNSDVRTALSKWLYAGLSRTDCQIPLSVEINIAADGQPENKVSISEDSIMTSLGLRRGDFYRIFGCQTVSPSQAFSAIGEKALVNGVVNSSEFETARQNYLASHPEITEAIEDIDFYRTRVDAVKSKTDKINSDWSGTGGSPAALAIKGKIQEIKTGLVSIGSSSNFPNISTAARKVAVSLDQLRTLIETAQAGDDQSLRDKANTTLSDIAFIINNVDEILSGSDQPDIDAITINQIRTDQSTSGSTSGEGVGFNRGTLMLMLAKKITPQDFFMSIGSTKIEDSIDLPTNSILYFAKLQSEDSTISKKDTFFRAIGQAQIEEAYGMPAFFFQGEKPGTDATLEQVKQHVAKLYNFSEAEAGARIMQALKLPGEFQTIERGTIPNNSALLNAAKGLDEKFSLKTGTSASFLNGSPLATTDLGDSDIKMLIGRLGITEETINKFIGVKNGTQSLETAIAANGGSEISYNSWNDFTPFRENEAADPANNTASCPITFSRDAENKFYSSTRFESNSYTLSDNTGTHSFPSEVEAQNYVAAHPGDKTDFVQTIAKSAAKTLGTDRQAEIEGKLKGFITNKNSANALTAAEVSSLAVANDIPTDVLNEVMTRKELIDRIETQKPIQFYLETVGKKTAEKRVMTSFLGGIGTTVAGQRIDASDIFDIISGNGREVVSRIGSRYLETQLNLPSNQIIELLRSPNAFIRNCNLSEIGGNLIGSFFGIDNLDLSGNIYENFGSSKIESVLGVPSKSFRGTDLYNLAHNMGEAKFAQAFNLPPDQILKLNINLSTAITRLFGQHFEQLPSSEKLGFIDNALGNPSAYDMTTSDISMIKDGLIQGVASFIAAMPTMNWATSTSVTSLADQEHNSMLSRIAQINSSLGLSGDKTKNLLTGALSPGDFVREVSGNTLTTIGTTALAGGLGQLLGLDDEHKALIMDLYTFYTIVTKPGNIASASRAGDRAWIFTQLQNVLGYNIDDKLDLPGGTISGIVVDPGSALPRLIDIGLRKIDQSLGLDPDDPTSSLSGAYSFTDNSQTYATCDAGETDCFVRPVTGNMTDVIETPIGSITTSTDRWNRFAHRIPSVLGQKYFVDWGLIDDDIQGVHRAQATADLLELVHGDLRGLMVSAAVAGARSIHLFGASSALNLPASLRISYGDIHYAIYGDTGRDNQYARVAEANYYNQAFNSSSPFRTDPNYIANLTAPPSEDQAMGATADPHQVYGAACQPGNTVADGCSIQNPDIPIDTGGFAYNADTGAAQTFHDFMADTETSTETDVNNAISNGENYYATHPDDQPRIDIDRARLKESARSDSRSTRIQNLSYRMLDAQLWRSDPAVPAGFTQTMREGTGEQRTQMFLEYLKNGLRTGKIFGIDLGFSVDYEYYVGLYGTLSSFWSNPGSFNFDNFVSSGQADKLETFLNGKVSDLFGFEFQPGTFVSIMHGIKTGNFKDDFTAGGKDLKSLVTIYKDWAISKITGWADRALGLPSGTIKAVYDLYKAAKAAKAALAAAQLGGDAAKISSAQASLATAYAAVITFVITTVFAKQLRSFESKLGLVPGTADLLVSMVVTILVVGLMFGPVGFVAAVVVALIVSAVLFVVINLFGVYRTELWCTADGYYPAGYPGQDPNNDSYYDNGHLGVFNGLDANAQKNGSIAAARYKARTLAGDALALAERIGDKTAIPSQIMVGRQEDVDYWQYKTNSVICNLIGGCAGTRAGVWYNPQTTGYTHIGF
ncbi:MAG: hypothetical protein WCG99_03140 [Candidatus Berkelbacteria bacterium]